MERERERSEVSILGIIDDTFWITILSQPRFDSLRFGRRATRTRMRCANEEHKMEMKMEMRTDDNERRSFELLLLRTPSSLGVDLKHSDEPREEHEYEEALRGRVDSAVSVGRSSKLEAMTL